MYTAQYGIWNHPDPCPPGFIPEVPFEWSALTMDLPETRERVKYAGWEKPLGGLNVVHGKEGKACEPDIWYRFYDAVYSSGASVAVPLKKNVKMV